MPLQVVSLQAKPIPSPSYLSFPHKLTTMLEGSFMADLFSPRREDGRAEWRVVYDHAVNLPYGTDVSFEQLGELLGAEDRGRAHRAVRRCNKEFVTEGKPRVLGNVRGVGYRVLQPADYMPAALNIQEQARRKMTSAVDLMRAAPVTDMSAGQRHWAHQVTMVLMDNELRLRSQEQWRKDAERRLAQLEERAGIAAQVIDGELEQTS